MVILGGNIVLFLVIGLILLILALILNIAMFFEIGIYALIPLGVYGLTFLISLIPFIGGFIATIMRLVPWMIVTVVIYYFENADSGLQLKPVFQQK